MYNYNPFSEIAAVFNNLTDENYLLHSSHSKISELFQENNFSICINFLINTLSNDIHLYGKNNLFYIKVNTDFLEFYSYNDQFASRCDINFDINAWYSLHITRNNKDINIYINGIKQELHYPPNFEKVVYKENEFILGHNFNGYIKRFFLYQTELTPNEVRDNIVFPNKKENLLLDIDFSNSVFLVNSDLDIYVNNPPNSSVNPKRISRVLNLDRKNSLVLERNETPIKGTTLLVKFYTNLNDLSEREFTIISDFSNIKLSVKLIWNPDKFFYNIHVQYKNSFDLIQSNLLDVEIQHSEWCHLAISIDDAIKIYVNEVEVDKLDDCKLSTYTSPIILGVSGNDENLQSNINIAYYVDFVEAKTYDEIKNYIVNPPFLFSKGVNSLLLFNESHHEEKLNGNAFKIDKNDFKYISTNEPIIDIPELIIENNIVLKEWEEYDDFQQSTIVAFADFISDFLKEYNKNDFKKDWFKSKDVAHCLNKNKKIFLEYSDVEEGVDSESTLEMLKRLNNLFNTISKIVNISTKPFSISLIIKGLVPAVAIGALIIVLIKLIDAVNNWVPERPKPDDDDDDDDQILATVFLKFVNDNSLDYFGIDFIVDGNQKISSLSDHNKVCYIQDKIKSQKLDAPLKVYYEVNVLKNKKNTPFKISFKEITTKNLLGDFIINVEKGISTSGEANLKEQKIRDSNKIFNGEKISYKLTGKVGVSQFYIDTKNIEIFSLCTKPIKPWDKERNLPWIDIVRISNSWINKNLDYSKIEKITKELILEQLCKNIYSEELFKFNNEDGRPAYVKTSDNLLELDLFLLNENIKEGKEPEFGVSSIDCSLILGTLAALHGLSVKIAVITSGKFNQGFKVNKIQPIGLKNYIYPFSIDDNNSGILNYHLVCIYEETDNKRKIYDSCFNLEGDNHDIKLLADNQKYIIDYNDNIYVNKLVAIGEVCIIEQPFMDTWKIKLIKDKEQ